MSTATGTNTIYFKGMALYLRLRERFSNPRETLIQAGIGRGQRVLDYGCGVGSYTLPAARLVGDTGKVYALDIHPLAIQAVKRRAGKENLANVETIHSGRDTGLPDESLDAVLLYDVFHMVPDQQALLRELYRILKSGGRLSVIPDHMDEDTLLRAVQAGDRFSLQARHDKAYAFQKGNAFQEGANGRPEPGA